MNCYEHTLIAKQDLQESDTKNLINKYESIITYDIPQVLYKYKKEILESLGEFNCDFIAEHSLYSLNDRIFKHPCFSGNYEFDFDDGTYTFYHHCYDDSKDKLERYKEFIDVKFWSYGETTKNWGNFINKDDDKELTYACIRTIKITRHDLDMSEDDMHDYIC